MFHVSGVGAAEPPHILDESVSGITETSAVLEATIDPGDGGVYYQFQLGLEGEELPDELLCPWPAKAEPPCEGDRALGVFPIRKIEGDVETVELDIGEWAALTHADALKPGTVYSFRVVVAPAVSREDDMIEWEEPAIVGMNEWFRTLGGPGAISGLPLAEPSRVVEVDLPMCRKGMTAGAGRCDCRGFPPRTVNGKVRCVKPKGLSSFRLLRHPVGLSHLPRSLQFGLAQWLPPVKTSPSQASRWDCLSRRGGRLWSGKPTNHLYACVGRA